MLDTAYKPEKQEKRKEGRRLAKLPNLQPSKLLKKEGWRTGSRRPVLPRCCCSSWPGL